MSTSEAGGAKRPNWALRAALAMLAAGVIALLYVLFAASSKPAPDGIARFAQGPMRALTIQDDAPQLPGEELQDADGAKTTLAAFRGEVILVNLWATWCAPCVEEMPTLAALQREFEGRGFRVVPVSIDDMHDRVRARDQLARLSDHSLPFLIDPLRTIPFSTRAPGIPTTILYDREGREIARLSGGADWNSEEARALIVDALKES